MATKRKYKTVMFGKRGYEIDTSRYSSRNAALKRARFLRSKGKKAFVLARDSAGTFFDVYVKNN